MTNQTCCEKCKSVEMRFGRPLTEGGGYPVITCKDSDCPCHSPTDDVVGEATAVTVTAANVKEVFDGAIKTLQSSKAKHGSLMLTAEAMDDIIAAAKEQGKREERERVVRDMYELNPLPWIREYALYHNIELPTPANASDV